MMPRRAIRMALVLGLVPMLGACAAAAIPVVAGALIAKKGTEGGSVNTSASNPPPEQRVAVFVGEETPKASLAPTSLTPGSAAPAAAQPARIYTVTEPAAPVSAPANLSTTITMPAAVPALAPAPQQPATILPAPAKIEQAAPAPALVAAPPKPAQRSALPPAPSPALQGGKSSGYLGLTAYAISRIGAPDKEGVLDVIDPSDPLGEPRRKQCGGLAPAVVIDLDPGLAMFDPAAKSSEPGLADALSALRAAGVTVLWSSAQPVEKAEAVHAALARAGLDPTRTDRLLLLKGSGDRKQARRVTATRNWCVIAMAGDRRGDFDEAFDYLRDPEATIPADKLFGQGWFVAPAPIP